MTPSLGLPNFLQYRTQAIHLLITLLVILKSYNSGIGREKRCHWQSMGKGLGILVVSTGTLLSKSVHLSTTNLEALRMQAFWIFMMASLLMHG